MLGHGSHIEQVTDVGEGVSGYGDVGGGVSTGVSSVRCNICMAHVRSWGCMTQVILRWEECVMITNDPALHALYLLIPPPLPAHPTLSPDSSPLLSPFYHIFPSPNPITQPHHPFPSPDPILNSFTSSHVLHLLKLHDAYDNELCPALCKFIKQLLPHCKMSPPCNCHHPVWHLP